TKTQPRWQTPGARGGGFLITQPLCEKSTLTSGECFGYENIFGAHLVATQTFSRVWYGNDKRARDLSVAQGAGCAPICVEMERYCNISGNRGHLRGRACRR
ncbi:unnamed protein product, partial [Ectocarpus sp. 12 AP-2014]